MRRFLSFALVASLLASCGDDSSSEEGDRRQGPEPVCGNGIVEKGETCDDGNRVDGDGCASFCLLEGSCDLPVELLVEAGTTTFSGALVPESEGLASECGSAGREVAFQVIVPSAGRLRWKATTEAEAATYVSTTCGGTSDLIAACVPASESSSVRFGGANLAFIVVDFAEDHEGPVPLSLDVDFLPDAEEGQECEPEEGAACTQGLTCYDVASPGFCVEGFAPVVESAVATRDGNALEIRVIGSDANGDANLITLRALDANNEQISGSRVNVAPEGLLGKVDIDEVIRVDGFFDPAPAAVGIRVQIWDAAGYRSQSRNVALGDGA